MAETMRTYGTLTLTKGSPPQTFVEPFDVDEAKAWLKLPPSGAFEQDLLLLGMISAAREQAEIFQNRDLIRKQYDLRYDYWPCSEIRLRAHLATVDLVRVRTSDDVLIELVEGTDYVVDVHHMPGLVTPPYGASWYSYTPWPSSSLLIRFTAGLEATDEFWSDAGARVKIGMKYLIAEWFMNRLPFTPGREATEEYDYSIKACLGYGALARIC